MNRILEAQLNTCACGCGENTALSCYKTVMVHGREYRLASKECLEDFMTFGEGKYIGEETAASAEGGKATKKLLVELPSDVHARLKQYSAGQGESMKDTIIRLILQAAP